MRPPGRSGKEYRRDKAILPLPGPSADGGQAENRLRRTAKGFSDVSPGAPRFPPLGVYPPPPFSQLPWTRFHCSLYIGQIPAAPREPPNLHGGRGCLFAEKGDKLQGAETAEPRARRHSRSGAFVPRLEHSRRAKRGGQTGESRFSTAICLFYDGFRLKTQANGRFHACDRSVPVPRGIFPVGTGTFSHGHENPVSSRRYPRKQVTQLPNGKIRCRARKGRVRTYTDARFPSPYDRRSARASPVARPGRGLPGMAAVVRRRRGNRSTLSGTRSLTRTGSGYRHEKEKRPWSIGQKTVVTWAKDRGLLGERPWSLGEVPPITPSRHPVPTGTSNRYLPVLSLIIA